MNYSINNFLEPSECSHIIEYMEENGVHFSYTKDTNAWYCKRIPDSEFTTSIKDRFYSKYYNGSFKLWFPLESFDLKDFNISLTKYYDGRWLDLHKDQDSQLTSVVVLNDSFSDGRFLLTDTTELKNEATRAVPNLGSVPGSKVDKIQKFDLKKGECLTFNGTKLYHGVMPVTKGVRYSLNLWMTNSDKKFIKPNKVKSFI